MSTLVLGVCVCVCVPRRKSVLFPRKHSALIHAYIRNRLTGAHTRTCVKIKPRLRVRAGLRKFVCVRVCECVFVCLRSKPPWRDYYGEDNGSRREGGGVVVVVVMVAVVETMRVCASVDVGRVLFVSHTRTHAHAHTRLNRDAHAARAARSNRITRAPPSSP